ncbi:hypothetical protein V6O07_06470, partial [Arthrospira platensis SPKY2]
MPPTAQMERGRLHPTPAQLEGLTDLMARHERGLIVCGPYCPGGTFPDAVAALARRVGYPLIADPLSGVRFGPHTQNAPLVATYDSRPPAGEGPELVLRFGAVPTSQRLNDYLLNSRPAHLIHVNASGVWADDSHRVSWFLQADEVAVCEGVGEI